MTSKYTIPKSPPIHGGKWNTWAAGGSADRGVCMMVAHSGHGGRSGYFAAKGSPIEFACCERCGTKQNAGGEWKPATKEDLR